MEITTGSETDGVGVSWTTYTIVADENEMRYLLAGLGALDSSISSAFEMPTIDDDDDEITGEAMFDAAEAISSALGFSRKKP